MTSPRKRYVGFLVAFMLFAHPAFATSVTVCNSGCDNTTIAGALTGVGAGNHTITVQLPYTTESSLTVSVAGTSKAAPLTIQAKLGETVNAPAITINAVNVSIKNFYFDQKAITLNAAKHNAVIDNNIFLAPYPYSLEVADRGLLTDNTQFINNTVLNGGKIGISGTNTLISGNLIDNNINTGIRSTSVCEKDGAGTICEDIFRVYGGDNITIRNNEVRNLASDQNHEDIFVAYGTANGPRNILVENNYFHDSDAQWADVENWGFTAQSHTITIRNNVLKNILFSGNLDYPYVKVHNNVFDKVGYYWGNATHTVSFMYDPAKGPCTDGELKNNIIVSGFTTASPPYVVDAECNVTPDYNMTVTSDWGSLTSSEANGVNGGNPLFVNQAGGDYRLQSGSPAIDTGVTISPTFSDRLGTSRPQGSAWDIGAYEYASGDTTPAAFSFTDNTGVALGSTGNSDNATLTGFDNTTTLVLTGDASCKYSINGAAWATANDNVSLSDNVALQNAASSSYSTAVSCTLNLGGVTDTWSRTTLAAVSDPIAPRFRGSSMSGGWR